MRPIRSLPDQCAVITPHNMGVGGSTCQQLPTVRAVWRFDRLGPRARSCCAHHAAELADHERLGEVVKFCDAAVED